MKYLVFFACIVAGCSTHTLQEKLNIKGIWRNTSNHSNSYTKLSFTDSTVVFDTLADTIFRFKYTIDQSSHTLTLIDMYGTKKNHSIIKADKDSLILRGLWHATGTQRYQRDIKVSQ